MAELDARFVERFDPGEALLVDAEALAPPTGVFLLARRDGHVAGCGGLQRLDDQTAEVKRMWVDTAHRGAGVGRLLLGALEEHARRLGHRRVVLDTHASLTEAMALYERSGYRSVERYNDNPYAQRWYEKQL